MDEAVRPLDGAGPLAGISVVLPRGQTVAALMTATPLPPFSVPVTAFIESLGRALRNDPAVRGFPELVALGYWARGATIKRLQQRFTSAYPGAVRRPRGLAFHVAPSNVDTIFVYSLLLSMLAGNSNLVRISSRAGVQSGHLLQVLDRALATADPEIRAAICVVRYGHDKATTDALSARADLRIVWGGDETVGLVRESPLAPAGTELVFPNKYSFAVFDAAAWNAIADKSAVARKFVNDALWFGQMACSSPRAVVWLGTSADVDSASASFWLAVDTAAGEAGLEWEAAFAVSKLVAEQGLALAGNAQILMSASNRVRVVRCAVLDGLGTQTATGQGFFKEYRIDKLAALAGATRRNWQTIVSFGIPADDWQEFLTVQMPEGIDRIVPIGSALDFDSIWDGVDLLAAMTRVTTLTL